MYALVVTNWQDLAPGLSFLDPAWQNLVSFGEKSPSQWLPIEASSASICAKFEGIEDAVLFDLGSILTPEIRNELSIEET